MTNPRFGFNQTEIVKRAFKYILIAVAVAFAANNIPQNKLSSQEIVMISIVAACMFAIVDLYAPSVYNITTVTLSDKFE